MQHRPYTAAGLQGGRLPGMLKVYVWKKKEERIECRHCVQAVCACTPYIYRYSGAVHKYENTCNRCRRFYWQPPDRKAGIMWL